MSEPIIGVRSILNALNITATSQFDGFPSVALANPLTYDRWRFDITSPARLYIDYGSPVAADYIGVAAHDLYRSGATVDVYTATGPLGVGAVLVATFTVGATGAPILKPFASAVSRYWFVEFTETIPGALTGEIGALYLGERITFERCLMGNYQPAPINRKTDFYDTTSESGQFLGRSIVRRGFRTTVSLTMATAPWIRSEFQTFVRLARLSPFFFAWNPGDYPDEVVFGRVKDDIGAEYTGDRNRMKSDFTIEGLGFDE